MGETLSKLINVPFSMILLGMKFVPPSVVVEFRRPSVLSLVGCRFFHSCRHVQGTRETPPHEGNRYLAPRRALLNSLECFSTLHFMTLGSSVCRWIVIPFHGIGEMEY